MQSYSPAYGNPSLPRGIERARACQAPVLTDFRTVTWLGVSSCVASAAEWGGVASVTSLHQRPTPNCQAV